MSTYWKGNYKCTEKLQLKKYSRGELRFLFCFCGLLFLNSDWLTRTWSRLRRRFLQLSLKSWRTATKTLLCWSIWEREHEGACDCLCAVLRDRSAPGGAVAIVPESERFLSRSLNSTDLFLRLHTTHSAGSLDGARCEPVPQERHNIPGNNHNGNNGDFAGQRNTADRAKGSFHWKVKIKLKQYKLDQ